MPVLKLPCSWVTISRGNHPNTEEIEELDVTLRSNGSGPCSYLLVIKDLTSKEIQQFEINRNTVRAFSMSNDDEPLFILSHKGAPGVAATSITLKIEDAARAKLFRSIIRRVREHPEPEDAYQVPEDIAHLQQARVNTYKKRKSSGAFRPVNTLHKSPVTPQTGSSGNRFPTVSSSAGSKKSYHQLPLILAGNNNPLPSPLHSYSESAGRSSPGIPLQDKPGQSSPHRRVRDLPPSFFLDPDPPSMWKRDEAEPDNYWRDSRSEARNLLLNPGPVAQRRGLYLPPAVIERQQAIFHRRPPADRPDPYFFDEFDPVYDVTRYKRIPSPVVNFYDEEDDFQRAVKLSLNTPLPSPRQPYTTRYFGSYNREGFANLGNTCYINAVLQALLNVPSFTDSLIAKKAEKCDFIAKDSLFQSFMDVLEQRDVGKVISPAALKDCVGKTYSRFSDNNQQDADEFLRILLETLELELDKCLGTGESVAEQKLENDQENQPANEIVPPPSAETEQGKSTEPTSKEPEKQQEPPLPSLPPNPVRDNFEFTVQTRLICEQCQHAANSEAVYRDLSLFIPNANQSTDNTATHNSEMPPPPPQGLSLNSLAEYFFSDSHVEYQCSHCKHDHAILQHRLSKLPPVLIVQLKRFDMDFERNQAIKRAEQVMIDETIQLKEGWCREGLITSVGTGGTKYRLQSVISHMGATLLSGHYVCDVLDKRTDRWKCYNDCLVEEIGDIKELNSRRKCTGYLFLYVAAN